MGRRLAFFALALALPVVATPTAALAQLRGASTSVLAPGVPLSAPDDANAVDVNPAVIGLLDGFGMVFVHAESAGDFGRYREGGDVVRIATPLPFGLGLGGSAQSIRPDMGSGELDRGMGNIALAFAPSDRMGVGASVRWFGAVFAPPAPSLTEGAATLDLAVTLRPSELLTASFIARDVNGQSGLGAHGVPPSFVLAFGLRPFGSRDLLFDVAGAIDVDGRVGVRGVAIAEVPYVGRVFGQVEVNDLDSNADLTALGGLWFDWGGLGVGGGAMGGDAFSPDAPGWFVTARVESDGRSGLPRPRYLLDLEVGGVGARTIVSLVRQLDVARHDDRVAGILLRMRDSSLGSAYAQELRLAIRELQTVGKSVVCHLESASGAELYACAGASRTVVDPAGGAWLVGPSTTTILAGDLAHELGIRVESVRIGRYKSAPEEFENRASSAPAREARDALYDDVYARLVSDLARDWDVPRARVREIVDGGPYLASELDTLDLVSGRVDESDLDEELEDALGGGFRRRTERPDDVERRWGGGRRVGVVVVDGDIVTGDNVDIPILGIRMSGSDTVVAAIDRMARDARVSAIVLRVDSPGGSVVASDRIFRAIRRAKRRKPVIASLGAVAASGGYLVASACDEIWADPATITGSIGVFYIKVDFAALAEQIGVGLEHVERGRRAGLDSLFRPFTADERAVAAEKVRLWYRMFLERVHQGRGMDVDAIDAVGRGRIYSGDSAVRAGLVDRLGGFGSALTRARELGELPDDAPIVVVPERPVTLLDYLLGVGALSRGQASEEGREGQPLPVVLPPALRELAQLAAVLGHSPDGMPLARLDEVVALP